jgi:ATP-binding cassette subfamily F protein uup
VPPLLNAQNLSKSFGPEPLFRNVSFNISERERLGLVGPNGSGKSTLLQILAGRMDPDSGEVAIRKNTRIGFVAQQSEFSSDATPRNVIAAALKKSAVPESGWAAREAETLGRAGFADFHISASTLSGGWRKRLAIAEALVLDPDILLLDEPTNHLDLEGIEWLESLLQAAAFACVVISHDRYFLENVTNNMAELSRAYPEGIFRVRGNYSAFLEKKEEWLTAQAKRQDSLQNRVRTEIEWLRRGPKARATKAKARIQKANELIGELRDMESRSRGGSAGIDFAATDRKTKRLIEFDNIGYAYGDRAIVNQLSFAFTAGMRLGLVGPNGSGKTTLLRLIRGEIQPLRGEIRRAESLKLVYFDQNRPLDPNVTLQRSLAPDSDSVIYRDRTIHVAGWADRFLFTKEQLNQPVSRLSGGERARVLIARLMLEPADVLLLDEPTNDLDIPTLEILEESLLDFPGALVLVTHDRYMLDRVSTLVLGLDGKGSAERFADYSQWEAWREQQVLAARTQTKRDATSDANRPTAAARKKLSYLESRDMETIEERITAADERLTSARSMLEDMAVVTDPKRLQDAYQVIEEAEAEVNKLYERWAQLEAKVGSG